MDINKLDLTPLHRAAYEGSSCKVQELIKAGAATTLKDRDGLTPDAIIVQRKLKVSSRKK